MAQLKIAIYLLRRSFLEAQNMGDWEDQEWNDSTTEIVSETEHKETFF